MSPAKTCWIVLLMGVILPGCGGEGGARRQAAGGRRAEPAPTSAALPASAPTQTKTPESLHPLREERQPTSTPSPLLAGVNGYHAEPRVFYRQGGARQGQLVVFFSFIVSEEVGPGNVALELEGQPATGVALQAVELFEAQDLLVNFKLAAEARAGRYDARVRIGEKEWFFPGIFEVRSTP